MNSKLFGVFCFIVISSFYSDAHAVVCKIIDERGQTTYTEKPSCGDDQTMRLESHGFTLDASAIEHEIPINHPSRRTKTLMFAGIDYYKNHTIDSRANVGKYLVGSGCIGNAPIFWKSLQGQHAYFLPKDEMVLSNLARSLRRHGYEATSDLDYLSNNSDDNLFIHGNVINLKIEACAEQSQLEGMQWDGESIPESDFRVSIVKLDVEWSVTAKHGEPTHLFKSTGYFDSRIPTGDHSYAVRFHVESAIQNAFYELLSNEDFNELLNSETASKPVKPVVPPSAPFETETFSLQGRILLMTIAAMIVLIVLKRLVDLLR